MERLYDFKDCINRTIKEVIGETGDSKICVKFIDNTYLIIDTCEGLSELSADEEITFIDEYDFGLITEEEYKLKLYKENCEQEERARRIDKQHFEYLKKKYGW